MRSRSPCVAGLALAALLVSARPVSAQATAPGSGQVSAPDSAPGPEDPEEPPSTREYLSEGCSWRESLAGKGIEIDVYYSAFLGVNAKGGQNTSGAQRYSHSFDLFVDADTERMGWWSGGRLQMQVKNNVGENINPDVGGLSQVVDDADFDESLYIDQLYYEHSWSDGFVRLRGGFLDYQTIIDRNAFANSEDWQFMNAALDNNPLVPLKIGFGAALYVDPTDWLGLIVGTADGDNELLLLGWDTAFGDTDHLMAYAQITARRGSGEAVSGLPGSYRWGIYYDPRSHPVFSEMGSTSGALGTWLSFDQVLFEEDEPGGRSLGAFYRYAYREEDSFAVSQFHSGGFELTGLLPQRSEDTLGLGYFDLVASDDFQQHVNGSFIGESGVELYYRYLLSPWCALTPSTQYISDAGGLDSSRDAWVFVLGARFRL